MGSLLRGLGGNISTTTKIKSGSGLDMSFSPQLSGNKTLGVARERG